MWCGEGWVCVCVGVPKANSLRSRMYQIGQSCWNRHNWSTAPKFLECSTSVLDVLVFVLTLSAHGLPALLMLISLQRCECSLYQCGSSYTLSNVLYRGVCVCVLNFCNACLNIYISFIYLLLCLKLLSKNFCFFRKWSQDACPSHLNELLYLLVSFFFLFLFLFLFLTFRIYISFDFLHCMVKYQSSWWRCCQI